MKIVAAALFSLCLASAVSLHADDRFALAVGEHGELLVFSPHGEQVGDFTAPAIAQTVAINGGPSFQLSYGRDVNNLLTAIISPDSSHPSDLHFSVLHKRIDTDRSAVVTLTFSKALNRVSVDPGYLGLVQVNAEKTLRREIVKTPVSKPAGQASSSSTASTEKPARKAASAKNAVEKSPEKVAEKTAPAHAPVVTASAPAGDSSAPAFHSAPAPRMNTELAPRELLPATSSNGEGLVQPVSTDTTAAASPAQMTGRLAKQRLFWAEPVTTANGATPKVGPHEMKLVAVHGAVSVKTPDGQTEPGTNGLLVPSGSTIETSAHGSAAVFMGGVDSARLVPNSGVIVAQNMEGTVRHTTIDLQKGAVFSRVGRRPGETQKYEVRTPEGVAAARGTEYLDVEVDGVHVVFTNKGTVDLYVNGQLVGTVTGGKSEVGMGSMPPGKFSKREMRRVLNDVLTELQPYNVTTIQALFDYESGKATAAEIQLIQEELYGSLISDGQTADRDTFFASQIGAAVAAAVQDILPNPTSPTPLDEPVSGQ
jgi:hypothetical protein